MMPNTALAFLFDHQIAFRQIVTGLVDTLSFSWERIRKLVIGLLVPQLAARPPHTLNPPKDYGPVVGQPALDFTADALDGSLVLLSDYLGKAVVLLSVSPTCLESRAVLLAYAAAEKQIASWRQIVVVSLGDDDETHHWAKELGLKFPVIIAPERSNSFKWDYRIPGTPFFCVLNANGRVQAQGYASTDPSLFMPDFRSRNIIAQRIKSTAGKSSCCYPECDSASFGTTTLTGKNQKNRN